MRYAPINTSEQENRININDLTQQVDSVKGRIKTIDAKNKLENEARSRLQRTTIVDNYLKEITREHIEFCIVQSLATSSGSSVLIIMDELMNQRHDYSIKREDLIVTPFCNLDINFDQLKTIVHEDNKKRSILEMIQILIPDHYSIRSEYRGETYHRHWRFIVEIYDNNNMGAIAIHGCMYHLCNIF